MYFKPVTLNCKKKTLEGKKKKKGFLLGSGKKMSENPLQDCSLDFFQSSCFAEESKVDGGTHINMERAWRAKRFSHYTGKNGNPIPQKMKIGPCIQLNEISKICFSCCMIRVPNLHKPFCMSTLLLNFCVISPSHVCLFLELFFVNGDRR